MENTEHKDDMELEVPAVVKKDDKKKKIKVSAKGFNGFITLVIVVVLILVIGFLVNQYTSLNLIGGIQKSNMGHNGNMSYDQDSYHAVFLSNGQVYFGKITARNNDSTLLENIYYLQVSNPLQQVPPTEAAAQPQLSLVKLGNELHAPEDHMIINNQHILFIEELKSDGKVVEAITAYANGGEDAAPVK